MSNSKHSACRLLVFDPAKRLTAQRALRHPYFTCTPLPSNNVYPPGFKPRYASKTKHDALPKKRPTAGAPPLASAGAKRPGSAAVGGGVRTAGSTGSVPGQRRPMPVKRKPSALGAGAPRHAVAAGGGAAGGGQPPAKRKAPAGAAEPGDASKRPRQ
jgi:hypothetical protein